MCRSAGPGRDAWIIFRPLNRIAAQPARMDKAEGSHSGRVMAAFSRAAVIDVTAADQSRVKAGCRTRGNHVKMPWQRAACSGFKCAIPLRATCSRNPFPYCGLRVVDAALTEAETGLAEAGG